MELNCHSIKGNAMYLVQYKANHADEFDVYGFVVYDQEHLDRLNVAFDKLKKRYTYSHGVFYLCHYFGSNESIDFENVSEMINTFTIKELNGNETQTLLTLFNMTVNIPKGQFFDVADYTSDWDEEHDDFK